MRMSPRVSPAGPGQPARPIFPGGNDVCSRTTTSSLFSWMTFISTRRSSSRSIRRSATPWRSPSGAIMVSTSSQFFQLARCSSLQNFERALSVGQSTSVSVNPRAFQSAARRDRYCATWKRNCRSAASVWMVRMLSARGGGTAPFGQREHVIDRRHRARAERPARRELGGLDGRRELGEDRLAGARSADRADRERRSARAPRARACSSWSCSRCHGSSGHSGSVDSTSVAPSCVAEHVLDLLRRRRDDRLVRLDSRET